MEDEGFTSIWIQLITGQVLVGLILYFLDTRNNNTNCKISYVSIIIVM